MLCFVCEMVCGVLAECSMFLRKRIINCNRSHSLWHQCNLLQAHGIKPAMYESYSRRSFKSLARPFYCAIH